MRERIKNKQLRSLSNKPFSIVDKVGVFMIKPVLSGYVLEMEGKFKGVITPWLSSNTKLHVSFKMQDFKIRLNDIAFNAGN